LLVVLNPTHAWPVVGIDVELAVAMRNDGVDDEGGSRGDIIRSVQQEKICSTHLTGILFHSPLCCYATPTPAQIPSTMKNNAYIPHWRGEAM
jgi:hypothetical protein